jgi:hypothetical protein
MNGIDRWLAAAEADLEARGLAAVKPLLQGLAGAVRVLRAAEWNDRADEDGATAERRETQR